MEYTTNYQLNQWDAQDAIKRTDFNADNAKIDAALGTLAAASAGHGNCKIEYGSYKGTGKYGSDNPKTLTFEGRPIVVMVFQLTNGYMATMGNSAPYGHFQNLNAHFSMVLSWGEQSVTWYSGQSATYQMNESGTYYNYFALVAADE